MISEPLPDYPWEHPEDQFEKELYTLRAENERLRLVIRSAWEAIKDGDDASAYLILKHVQKE
jgi:hypothetical protein